MKQIPILASVVSLFLLLHLAKSEEKLVRDSLLEFLSKLSNNKSISIPGFGWNTSSDPCSDRWRGITCDLQHFHVKNIDLGSFDLQGLFDPKTLCNVQSLSQSLLIINVSKNSIHGENLDYIKNCSELTHLDISGNQFSGQLPNSISELRNLQTLDVSGNKISGSLPDLSQMHGLAVFLAQENDFSGAIPELDFSRFKEFNVSHNFLSGRIPGGLHGFPLSSFLDNLELCGPPLPNQCSLVAAEDSAPEAPPSPPPVSPSAKHGKSGLTNNQILMYIGYVLIGFVALFLILLCLRKRGKKRREAVDADNKVAAFDDSMMKPSFSTVELKAGGGVSKSEYSTASAESGQVSTSLIVLSSPEANGLRFEDLLKAPAELLGRGSHGSVYKVACEAQGMNLAVKRIKDWPISSGEFRQRMRRLSQVKHPNVMPAIAHYSSGQEKLIVYEFQQNGSLFRQIHGNESPLDWSSRLTVAATIADAIAYMHEELQYDRIPHGNLKSSNILLNRNMEACISEYGLMLVEGEEQKGGIVANRALEAAQEDYKSIFKVDTYAFGVVLLELLTGRMVLTEGLDLASWVVAVVREEWTVEVFDKSLIREGVSEERMVNVLQIAIKCVAKSLQARPSMRQVALAVSAIREDDERSLDVSELSITRSFVAL
ncbi:hypothetical protein C2S52_002585 [Perilla frutescens var. hirtella]|nr:hypothetical protein C2S51_012859 [Perilla frutescens var. frutescens]KAH6792108.1 hypothetical protein C2S52_002585 [Perilla frutescens var. hirtella]